MRTIALVSDRQILAEGLKGVIAGVGEFTLSAVCPAHDFLVDHLQRNECPNLLIIDVTPSMTLDALNELRCAAPAAAAVLWVEALLPEFAAQALRLGVRAFLPKSSSIEIHVDCLRRVAKGEMWIQNDLSTKLLSAKQTHLTRRERQLLTLLAQGLKNKEIAWQTGITEGTVKVYLSRLFVKVGASDRFELALLALRNMVPEQSFGLENITSSSRTGGLPLVASQFVSLPFSAPQVR